jgi:adenylate cyclase
VAGVFISHGRSAETKVRQAVAALRRSGFEAWSDAELPPHRDFTKVIEEQLTSADVVLVLWSGPAAESQWVRAEADFARERRKLVQATLDGTIPPMPFNQIHCANLTGWRGGATDAQWLKVIESISQLTADGATPSEPQSASHVIRAPRSSGMAPRTWLLAGTLVVALVLAGGAWLLRGSFLPTPNNTRVAILPFDTLSSSADANFFADGLADQIGTTLSNNHIEVLSHDDAVTLRGPDRDKRVGELGVGLLLDGTVQSDGQTLKATVHLDDAVRHVTLWSGGVDGPAAQEAQLQTTLAATIVNVLDCSRRALSPAHGLSDPTLLTAYLHACDVEANSDVLRTPSAISDVLTSLRQVTAGAPDFAPAHADLALNAVEFSGTLPPDAAAAERREAASEAARALALDPKLTDAYIAQADLAGTDYAKSEPLLRTVLAMDPTSANANWRLAQVLGQTGRLHESGQFAQKAAAIDPAGKAGMAETIACMDGDASRSADDLMAAQKQNPTQNAGIWSNLSTCLQVAGRWDDAIALANDAAHRPAMAGAMNPVEAAYLQAGKTRAPGDLAKARTLLLPQPGDNMIVLSARMVGQSSLGFVDDAFVTADRWASIVGAQGNPYFLFFPLFAPMRRDPRFIELSNRLGLVDFWRKTGHWPDFCSDPSLPYNCKAEAAKLASGPPAKA